MVKLYCKNTGTYGKFKEGTTLLDALDSFEFERPLPILSVRVNNVSEGLKYRLYNNKDVEYLDYRSYAGRNTYCRSLCFLLCKAAVDVFPGCQVRLRRPVSKGYFVELKKVDGSPVTDEDAALISIRLLRQGHDHDIFLQTQKAKWRR